MYQRQWFAPQWFSPSWFPELGGPVGGKGKGGGGRHLHASLLKSEMIKRMHERLRPLPTRLLMPHNRLLVEVLSQGVQDAEEMAEVKRVAYRASWAAIMAEA